MLIAVVYNSASHRVLYEATVPNLERCDLTSIQGICEMLDGLGHCVGRFEGDIDLIDNLKSFFPAPRPGVFPGLVLNLSYGLQGESRQAHVPGILEMLGVPYVGSGPLAQAVAMDKAMTKRLLSGCSLPTPRFAVIAEHGLDPPDLRYPVVAKPVREGLSLGVSFANDPGVLRGVVDGLLTSFRQPVLVEEYVPGREINVSLLGNGKLEVFPAVEIVFDEPEPRIYTREDKLRISGRKINLSCPAVLDARALGRAADLGRETFRLLNCKDFARVDMRLDSSGELTILELNTSPSLRATSSFVIGASQAGLGIIELLAKLIEIAVVRYNGG